LKTEIEVCGAAESGLRTIRRRRFHGSCSGASRLYFRRRHAEGSPENIREAIALYLEPVEDQPVPEDAAVEELTV
jgi:hypothetical protein